MGKKLENWWTFHKGIVIGAVFFLLLMLYVISSLGKEEKKQILFGEMINNVLDDAVTTKMEEDILHQISDNESGEVVTVDTALTMDTASLKETPISDANTQDSMATITAYVYAHDLDFMICEKEVFDYYKNLNAFADLEELFSAEDYVKIKDFVSEDGLEGYGIDISDTAFVNDYKITLKEPVLAIISGSEQKENAVKMVRWIFGLQ